MSDEPEQTPDNADSSPAADPQSIEGLFVAALGHASALEREAFLSEACGDDAERRRRIDALLRAYEDAGSFLEKPPVGASPSETVSLAFLTPSDDPSLLGMLGPYEVYEVLGRGGMGIVFRARDPKLNRVVAIKVLAPELAANPNARRRFLREAQAAAAISHPHVVTIHAVDEGTAASGGRQSPDGGGSTLPFLVMECIVGQTLQQKLDKQGSLRLMEILRIGHQTAQGLVAAHKQGLIHRDIKPANILLENGVERVKITDFGLARAADDVSITRTGEVSGTPQYMSPEQASGDVVDHRSDLFSLGSVLYAMCTGRSPFRATTLAAAIRRVCDDTPRPIEEINAEVPQWLVEIVNRLLAKNPEDRIQSADEVATLLGDHLAGIQQPTGAARVRAETARTHQQAQPVGSVRYSTAAPSMATPATQSVGRFAIWLGALALLVPVFMLLGGLVFGDGDSMEASVVVALIAVPIGLISLALGLIDVLPDDSPTANGVFLLMCILLGPIGILLYLVRRDRLQNAREQQAATPSAPPTSIEQGSDSPTGTPMPRWLATPLPGPAKLLAVLPAVVAALLLGQAVEQWSDVSSVVGGLLFVASVALGFLAYRIAMLAGVRFTGPFWAVTVPCLLPFVLLGAQVPDREFKQGLAGHPSEIALIVIGTLLVVGIVLYCLHQATRADSDNPPAGRLTRDGIGRGLIIAGVGIWAGLVVWMVGVGTEEFPAPAYEYRNIVGVLVMSAVLVGGLLWATGMILRRRVLTPGLVHQLATESDARRRGNEASPLSESSTKERSFGWRTPLGTVIALIFVMMASMVVMLIVPSLQRQFTRRNPVDGPREVGFVQVEFDSDRPITLIRATGDIGAAQSAQKSIAMPVISNPYQLPLPAGVYDLTMTYQADGQTGTFQRRAGVTAGETLVLDVRQNIAIALQTKLYGGDPASGILGSRTPSRPRGIRIVALGDIEIGRITVDEKDVKFEADERGDVHLPAAAGHRELTIFLQDGQKYHYGVDLKKDGSQTVQVPPGAEGLLRVNLVDDDLEVELRPLGDTGSSLDDDPVIVQPPGNATGIGVITESKSYRVPAGRYAVWITDGLAGWVGKDMHSPTPYTFQEIEVAPGRSQAVTAKRNLNVQVDQFGGWSDRLYDFLWNQETYTLTRPQAHVVHRLFESYAKGEPEADASWLVFASEHDPGAENEAVTDESSSDLAAVFNDGEHPAWGTLIVPGEQADTYRLAKLQTSSTPPPSPRAKINITFEDGGLKVHLDRFLDNSEETASTGSVIEESMSLFTQPGKYRVVVEDELAGWHTKTKYGETGPVLYEYAEVDLQQDQPTDLAITRNLHKLAAGHGRLHSGMHPFLWNGQTYDLSSLQAVPVLKLLYASARGNREVHEGVLLSGATFIGDRMEEQPMTSQQAEAYLQKMTDKGYSLKGLFDDGKHPAWETMIVEGEKPNTYRLTELKPVLDETPAATAPTAETATVPGTQPVVIGSLTPGQFERAGQLTIDIKDEGFQVAVRRMSAFDGYVPGSEQQVTDVGETYLRVHPGEHEILARDLLFGVVPVSRNTLYGISQWPTEIVNVSETEPASVVIKRNLGREADRLYRFGKKGLLLGAPLLDVLWDGQSFPCNAGQAFVIGQLMQAYAANTPEITESALLEAWPEPREMGIVRPPLDPPDSIKTLFEDGEHPAWGTVIVPGDDEGTYRLILPRGTLIAEGDDEGMYVTINPVKKDLRFSPAILKGGDELLLPPGDYVCSVYDGNVSWGTWTNGFFGGSSFGFARKPLRQETISVSDGERTNVDVVRKWSDYLNPPEPTEEKQKITFTWYPRQSSRLFDMSFGGGSGGWGFGGSLPDGIVNLNREQFPIVLALLKAHVAGEPEMAEVDLLKHEELAGKTWQEIFPDNTKNAMQEIWKTIIVPGETEGTWRLKPPPAAR